MAVAWPLVKDRLVALIPTLTPAPALTFDGPVPTGEAPASYCCVGWQPSTDDTSAGSYEQTSLSDGFGADETGTVLLEFGAVSGDDMPSAFLMVDALQASVQADQTLGGVLGPLGTVAIETEVVEAQNNAGAVQRLLVSLNYTAALA